MVSKTKVKIKSIVGRLRRRKRQFPREVSLCPSYSGIEVSTSRLQRKGEKAMNDLCEVLSEKVQEESLSFRDAFAIGMHEMAENELSEFCKAYFGKEMKDLTVEENQILDSFGAYGASMWLIDHKH
jgi:hypothetical protein